METLVTVATAKWVNRHYLAGFAAAAGGMILIVSAGAGLNLADPVGLWFRYVFPAFAVAWFFVVPWFWRPARGLPPARRSDWLRRAGCLVLAAAGVGMLVAAVRHDGVNWMLGAPGLGLAAAAFWLGGPQAEARRAHEGTGL